jgi:deoxyhypusine synthase
MASMQLTENDKLSPGDAKDAVFVASDSMPEGVPLVQGIDFNLHRAGDISVVDLVEGMSNMGFQASALGDAVRIINGMVRRLDFPGPVSQRVHF